MLKLHFAPQSRAVRIVWLLEELGLPYTLERYSLTGPELRSPEYRAINPMGRVPVLEDGDVRLNESGAIVEYVLARHAPGQLRPPTEASTFPEYLQWLHYAEGMLMPPVNSYMVETVFLPPERRSDEHVRRAQKLMGRMLAPLDAALAGRDYLIGEFSAADIMTGSAAISASQLGVDTSGLPALQGYVERLSRRPAYQKATSI